MFSAREVRGRIGGNRKLEVVGVWPRVGRDRHRRTGAVVFRPQKRSDQAEARRTGIVDPHLATAAVERVALPCPGVRPLQQ